MMGKLKNKFIRAGDTELSPRNLFKMNNSSNILLDINKIKKRFEKDGYIFFESFLNRGKILLVRELLIQKLDELNRINNSFPKGESYIFGEFGYGFFYDFKIQSRKIIKNILESPRIFSFFKRFFEVNTQTYSYKWLRAVATEEYTGAHCDCVYMGCGSKHLITVWIPLGDISVNQGTLLINPNSHRYNSLNPYYNLNVDKDVPNNLGATGHLTTNPISWKPKNNLKLNVLFEPNTISRQNRYCWVTENMKAGDVVILGIYTIHMSTTNKTKWFRLSCDTRWQPSNEPIDSRWNGKNPSDGNKNRLFIGDKPRYYKPLL